MKPRIRRKGFSLIELMIVVAIVAILVALALPNYTRYVRKANRGEAQQLLLNWANNQEIWRANDSDYATTGELAAPARSATAYTLTATATGDQANDEERNQSCTVLTIDQSNAKTHPFCW
jgi:type IV pilus assembly protein PilE